MKGQSFFNRAKQIEYVDYFKVRGNSKKRKRDLINEATLNLRKASYLGHPEAQFYLAYRYEYGTVDGKTNVSANNKKMIYWLKKSADNGYPDAMDAIARLFMYEKGIQDFNLAKKYFEMHDASLNISMSESRKFFLKLLDSGCFVADESGYYTLIKNWKEKIKLAK